MGLLILLATIIVTVIFFFNKELTIIEYLKTVGIVNAAILIVFAISIIPFNNDVYFQSGKVCSTTYHPAFVEQYEQIHTVSTGKSTYTYFTTEYEHHKQYWTETDSLKQTNKISHTTYLEMRKEFGNKIVTTRPYKCTCGGHFYKGDPYLYTTYNIINSYRYPTTKLAKWYNPIKGTDSLFNEVVTDNYERKYPQKIYTYGTNRLMNEEKGIVSKHDIDVLNTKIYESKKANIIVVKENNFSNANKLEAYWNGGSYNDTVICISGSYAHPTNVKVFGYNKNAKLKTDLQSYIVDNGITKTSLKGIYDIVISEYQQMDFGQFRYIKHKCPWFVCLIATVVAIIISFICVVRFSDNYDRRD